MTRMNYLAKTNKNIFRHSVFVYFLSKQYTHLSHTHKKARRVVVTTVFIVASGFYQSRLTQVRYVILM